MTKNVSLQIENEEIVFADLTNRDKLECVVVCKSGNTFLIDLSSQEKQPLGKIFFNSIPDLITDFEPWKILQQLNLTELAELLQNTPADVKSLESIIEGNPKLIENLTLNLKLYSYQNYVCLVQKNGIFGTVFNLNDSNYRKNLKRGDYCVRVSSFPIAFYTKANQTFLIHGTDWNRLDITCLETDILLTDRIVDYDTDSNYFDYFHSTLSISPGAEHFTSNGWIWHPFGQITLYSTDDFLTKFELSHKSIEMTDEPYDLDWDRPLCWVDEKTLAVGFSKNVEDYGEKVFPNEILLVDIIENKIVNRIRFDGFANTSDGDVFGELSFDREKLQFIAINSKTGLFISDVRGDEIFRDKNFSGKYSVKHKVFYKIDCNNKTIEIFDFGKS